MREKLLKLKAGLVKLLTSKKTVRLGELEDKYETLWGDLKKILDKNPSIGSRGRYSN